MGQATVEIERGRRVVLPVTLSVDITGRTLRAQIRAERSETSTLLATWTITVVDGATGAITLSLPPTPFVGRSMVWTDVVDVATDETLLPVVRLQIVSGVTDAA